MKVKGDGNLAGKWVVDYSDVQIVPDISRKPLLFYRYIEYYDFTYNFTISASEKVHIG
jgi:hypothetical protein